MSKKNKLFSFVFLALVFLVTFGSIFHDEDIPKLISYLSMADFRYVIASVLCVLTFICGESVILFYMFHNLGIDAKPLRCCAYSFIGFFYSCITPSASGGQPMQIMAMRKDKIPVAVSTVVLAIVAITYKLVLVLIGIAVLITNPFGVMEYLSPVLWFMYLGIFLNIICIIGLLLLVFKQDWVHNISMMLLNLYDKIFHLKSKEKRIKDLERITTQYEGTAEYYRSHARQIYIVFIITFVQRFCLFLITWLTYRSFGLVLHRLPLITTLQAMISVASDMMPLPGGMGVSEKLFIDIFNPIFGEALLLPGMVISRGISYYTQLLVSGIVTLFVTTIPRKIKKERGLSQ